MIFIDYPRYYIQSDYKNAIDKMVDSLKKIDGIVAIYQLGSIGQPGISDIDMLVVFKDSVSNLGDPRATLNRKEKYLFSHSLYGLSEAHILGASKFGFFFHTKLLWGEKLFKQDAAMLEEDDFKILKTQIALEFLLKMYINTVVEQTYGILKVRGLLLQAKALLMDLDLLDIQECRIREMLEKILAWREAWFDSSPSKAEIDSWLIEFQKEFPLFLNDLFLKYPFYLLGIKQMRVGRNIDIKYSSELFVSHRGLTFPWFGFIGRKYFNLLHRINQFDIYVPFQTKEIPKIILDSQKNVSVTKLWLGSHAKYFMPFASSFNVY